MRELYYEDIKATYDFWISVGKDYDVTAAKFDIAPISVRLRINRYLTPGIQIKSRHDMYMRIIDAFIKCSGSYNKTIHTIKTSYPMIDKALDWYYDEYNINLDDPKQLKKVTNRDIKPKRTYKQKPKIDSVENNCKLLAYKILMQAAEDFKHYYSLYLNHKYPKYRRKIEELEDFFKSDWAEFLAQGDCGYLIDKLKDEVKKCKK